jgi:uncharacterized membrane-anchored protein
MWVYTRVFLSAHIWVLYLASSELLWWIPRLLSIEVRGVHALRHKNLVVTLRHLLRGIALRRVEGLLLLLVWLVLLGVAGHASRVSWVWKALLLLLLLLLLWLWWRAILIRSPTHVGSVHLRRQVLHAQCLEGLAADSRHQGKDNGLGE